MKLNKWISRLSVLSLIVGSSSLLGAQSEFSYNYSSEDENITYEAQLPTDWESTASNGPQGILDY